MARKFILIALMLAIIALPLLFRQETDYSTKTDDVVVIITAHTESIRYEFERAFARWYKEQTGRTVHIDWRMPGGASEIMLFLDATYTNAFRNYWTHQLQQPWSIAVQEAHKDSKLVLDDTPADDTLDERARRVFLATDVGCGIDIWFGGGSYDFGQQAKRGRLIPSSVLTTHPHWFSKEVIPLMLQGNYVRDPDGRWLGATFTSFGIVFNPKVLRSKGFTTEPRSWADLADPRLIGEVALSDPTKSGSTNKAFEMIVQQQIAEIVQALDLADQPKAVRQQLTEEAIALGWNNAMQLIQLIAANASFFNERAGKTPMSVAVGNCAVGMSVDFYAHYQQQSIIDRGGGDRVRFVMPQGGSAIVPDCIGLLRGGPNKAVANAFIEFVLSMAGQKLWAYRVGEPGGPERYALWRLPVRKDFYTPQNLSRSIDHTNPYADSIDFEYHPEWTLKLFSALRFVIRVAFIDPHPELKRAWASILRARTQGREEDAARALAVLSDIMQIDHAHALGEIREALRSGDPLTEIQLQARLTNGFIHRYRQAAAIAQGAS